MLNVTQGQPPDVAFVATIQARFVVADWKSARPVTAGVIPHDVWEWGKSQGFRHVRHDLFQVVMASVDACIRDWCDNPEAV